MIWYAPLSRNELFWLKSLTVSSPSAEGHLGVVRPSQLAALEGLPIQLDRPRLCNLGFFIQSSNEVCAVVLPTSRGRNARTGNIPGRSWFQRERMLRPKQRRTGELPWGAIKAANHGGNRGSMVGWHVKVGRSGIRWVRDSFLEYDGDVNHSRRECTIPMN